MKMLARVLGLLSVALAAVVIRPVNSYQGFMVKSTATAQTPALAVIGTVAAALGFRCRSMLAMLSGAVGAGIGAWYIRMVTAPNGELERAFGKEWRKLMPNHEQRRMIQRRLTWRLPTTPEPRWTRDIPFATVPGTNRQLLADVWEPADEVERTGTAVVYLYGGSWHFFDKDVFTRPLFRQLTAQGHVVMDAGHRSCPETDVIGMVGDVHRAVAWIKSNAGRYGVDPSRIIVMGGSSGAHIALLAAYAPDDSRLKPTELESTDTSVMAVVSWYGIPEMASAIERWLGQEASGPAPSEIWERREPGSLENAMMRLMMGRTLTAEQSPPGPSVRQLVQNLLGVQPGESAEMYGLASPIHHVGPHCPPTLLLQGTHDAVVPLEAARRLFRALEAANVPVGYIEYPWTEHAFDLMYPPLANPGAKAALYDVERFISCATHAQSRRAAAAMPELAADGR